MKTDEMQNIIQDKMTDEAGTLLEIRNLKVRFTARKKVLTAVDGVSLSIRPGEIVGVVGESGSGKSMSLKAVLGLLDKNFQVSGQAVFDDKNLIGVPGEELRKLRGNQIGMVLQNPMTCFDPLYRIGSQMAETFAMHTDWNGEKIRSVSLEVLDQMRIHDGAEVLEKYPHQLSGGMLQRIMIGIAMALSPELLIADEPTTAIDAITQYEILVEFERIKREKKTAMIFITHDLGAISKVADRIMVMNSGRIVDQGDFHHILHHAKDPYTRLLVEKRMAVMDRYRDILKWEERKPCLN